MEVGSCINTDIDTYFTVTGDVLLQRNSFEGNIPTSITTLANLEVLNLSRNQLRGNLTEGISALEKLQILDVSFNFLGGPIPDSIGDMTSLVEVRLNTNAVNNGAFFGFTGPIPVTVGFLDNLVRFDVFENLLTGSLPSEFGFLDNLEILDVALNPSLGGEIPAEFENLVSLRELYIGGTGITGVVPSGLCQTDLYLEISCGDTAPVLTCDCCTCGESV